MDDQFDDAPKECKDEIDKRRRLGILDLNRNFPKECRGYGSDF